MAKPLKTAREAEREKRITAERSAKIKQVLKEKGWPVIKLERMAGFGHSTLSHKLNNTAPIYDHDAMVIAEVLEIDEQWLLGNDSITSSYAETMMDRQEQKVVQAFKDEWETVCSIFRKHKEPTRNAEDYYWDFACKANGQAPAKALKALKD